MTIAKQMDIRANIKKYFDQAYEGDIIIVPRKENKNIVIISEDEYNRLRGQNRLTAYSERISGRVSEENFETPAKESVKADNLKKLKMIKGLKDGWNGNDAPAFSDLVIDNVCGIIEKIDIQPEVFPTALGSIQLEYDNSRRDHMEIEINDSDLAEIFIVKYSGEEYFESIAATSEEINKRVGEFYG